jgi:hypothetical protein
VKQSWRAQLWLTRATDSIATQPVEIDSKDMGQTACHPVPYRGDAAPAMRACSADARLCLTRAAEQGKLRLLAVSS